jgi:hypothetical protein
MPSGSKKVSILLRSGDLPKRSESKIEENFQTQNARLQK